MTSITKAVFPVAGLGTRFLPATKAMPKELLPIIDKPIIQYAVEEAIAAGITDLGKADPPLIIYSSDYWSYTIDGRSMRDRYSKVGRLSS